MNKDSTMFYFLLFFTMHYCVFVLIEPGTDTETAVDSALAPFDETLEVEPYRVHLNHDGVRQMATHFKIEPANLHALADKLPQWTGHKGGVDRDGLYYLTACNPDGRWDWYEIGGRWDGFIPRSRANTIKAGTLAASRNLARCLPYNVLTPEGEWLEHERAYFGGDWNNVKKEQLKEEEWLELVQKALKRWPEHRVVCVDIHR